jgi:hypothetical protein
MLSRAKLISIWVTAALSTAVACYAFVTAITLALLAASSTWTHKYVWMWTSIALFLFCLFGVVSFKTIVRLVHYYYPLSRHPDSRDTSNP